MAAGVILLGVTMLGLAIPAFLTGILLVIGAIGVLAGY